MFSAGTSRAPYPHAGGHAPQPQPIGFIAKAAAHSSLAVLFVASVVFAAAVTVMSSAATVVLSWPSAASQMSPAYLGTVRPEAFVICRVTKVGVCNMRHSSFGSAAAVRVSTIEALRADVAGRQNRPAMRVMTADEIEAEKQLQRQRFDLSSYSEAQMFALMNASTEHRHQAIWHHARLNIFEVPPFTLSTFRELSERGHLHKPDGSKYHRLSPEALSLADAVADELVRTHKIHAPVFVHTRGQKSKLVTFRCTCGWSCGLTAGDNMQAKAARAFTSHLTSVNAIERLGEALAPRHIGEG